MNKYLTIIIFSVIVIMRCSQSSHKSYVQISYLEKNGIKSIQGETINSSPIIVLREIITNQYDTLIEVLLSNRKTVLFKKTPLPVYPIDIQNDSITGYIENPDNEEFYEKSDQQLTIKPPYCVLDASKKKFPVSQIEMMLYNEDYFYPMFKVKGQNGTVFVETNLLKISIPKISHNKKNILDQYGIRGLTKAPFISNEINEFLSQVLLTVQGYFQYNGTNLIKTSQHTNFGEIDLVIHNFDSDSLTIKTLFSFTNSENEKSWVLCYKDGNPIAISFNERYTHDIMDFKLADLNGNGFYELILKLGYIYGDGYFIELMTIPDNPSKETLNVYTKQLSGNSGENNIDMIRSTNWFIRKTEKKDLLVINKHSSDGSIDEEVVDYPY